MAKKARQIDNGLDPVEQTRIQTIDNYGAVDEMFKLAADEVATRIGKQETAYTEKDPMNGMPIPSLAGRYLFSMSYFLYGKLIQLAGIEATFKSTMAAEMAHWHRLCGGTGALCAAESKDNDQLRNGLFNYNLDWLRVHDCGSANTWQKYNTFYMKAMKKHYEKNGGPGRAAPFVLITDSLTGKGTDEAIKNIMETGSAGKGFPDLANMLTKYCQVFPQMLVGWPTTWIGVNHLKTSLDVTDPDPKIPGGQELKHQSAVIVEMSRGRTEEKRDYTLREISMRTLKNTYGPDKRRIKVELRIWDQEDEPGFKRTYCRWEWWAASIYLLQGDFFTKTKSEAMMPRIKEVLNIQERSGGIYGKLYYCKELGVTKDDAMPPHELGMQLEANVDMLDTLYPLLGITRRTAHQPSVDFISANHPQFAYHQLQALRNKEIMDRQAQMGVGRATTTTAGPGASNE